MSQTVADRLFYLDEVEGVNVVTFTLPDEMDAMEFDRLNEVVRNLLNGRSSNRWVLDLSQVHYMGSAVLGLMVNIRQQVKTARGRIVLCGLSQKLTGIFHNCCLERLFTIVKTRDDALARV